MNTAAVVLQRDVYPYTQIPTASATRKVASDFVLLAESYLLAYGYATARAYRCDLERWQLWCLSCDQQVSMLMPTPREITEFLQDELMRDYSPNTVARRRTALRGFLAVVDTEHNPVDEVEPIRRVEGGVAPQGRSS